MSHWRPAHNTDEHWCYCVDCEALWAKDYTKKLPKLTAPVKRSIYPKRPRKG